MRGPAAIVALAFVLSGCGEPQAVLYCDEPGNPTCEEAVEIIRVELFPDQDIRIREVLHCRQARCPPLFGGTQLRFDVTLQDGDVHDVVCGSVTLDEMTCDDRGPLED